MYSGNIWRNYPTKSTSVRKMPPSCEQSCLPCAHGLLAAFFGLDVKTHRALAAPSLAELSAYVNWRHSLREARLSEDECHAAWERLDNSAKRHYVPQSPNAVLAADPLWAPLLRAGPPPCGDADASPGGH
mmetsp:Transcript_39303/g.113460  ORF Transcript_39303/g.113460 Transcript_39303/m.113460 type:complete len:130 (-) Transcript_39303:303-692(-)